MKNLYGREWSDEKLPKKAAQTDRRCFRPAHPAHYPEHRCGATVPCCHRCDRESYPDWSESLAARLGTVASGRMYYGGVLVMRAIRKFLARHVWLLFLLVAAACITPLALIWLYPIQFLWVAFCSIIGFVGMGFLSLIFAITYELYMKWSLEE